MQEELKEYQNLILGWARDKNITGAECIPMQKLKLIEEVGEIANAIVKNKKEEIIDGIGDAFVVLTILAEQYGEEFEAVDVYSNYKDTDLADLLSLIIYSDFDVDFGVLLELCKRFNLNILDCVSQAWNEKWGISQKLIMKKLLFYLQLLFYISIFVGEIYLSYKFLKWIL